MFKIINFTPRPYQINIFKTCKENNTLVCLPTGTGKSKIAILLAIERLNKFPDSKIIILTPTKPLANQICNEFKNFTDIPHEKIILLTGSLAPEKRTELYLNSKIIVATPQTIEQDLNNIRTNLKNTSGLIIDECHRSRENYANTKVAKIYFENGENPLILALTASPGSTKEKIDEIKNNLMINNIEIRTDIDEDLQEFIQKKDIIKIEVDFPEKFKDIHKLVKEIYQNRLQNIRSFGVTKPLSAINKVDLINLQKMLQIEIKKKNKSAFYGISLVAQLLKLSYALELLETQSLFSFKDFIEKLKIEETKAAKNIIKEPNLIKALELTNKLISENVKHPKLLKLILIIKEEIELNKEYKSIVFANYRSTVQEIVNELNKNNIKSSKFVGQADRIDKGQKQKEQIEIINKFKNKEFNILVASSVAEEGIDIPEVNSVIFFEPIGSELRRIQRSGRTARTIPGKIIFLITKETRDVGYYWSSIRKENKMKKTLIKMNKEDKQSKLS